MTIIGIYHFSRFMIHYMKNYKDEEDEVPDTKAPNPKFVSAVNKLRNRFTLDDFGTIDTVNMHCQLRKALSVDLLTL